MNSRTMYLLIFIIIMQIGIVMLSSYIASIVDRYPTYTIEVSLTEADCSEIASTVVVNHSGETLPGYKEALTFNEVYDVCLAQLNGKYEKVRESIL